jgi:hypothetical protein
MYSLVRRGKYYYTKGFDRNDCLLALRSLIKYLGHKPMIVDVELHRANLSRPPYNAYCRIFGGLRNALDEARKTELI